LLHWQSFIIQINIKHNSDRAASGEEAPQAGAPLLLPLPLATQQSIIIIIILRFRFSLLPWPFMQTTITISLASLSFLGGFLLPLLVSISADIFGDLSGEGKKKKKSKTKKTNIHHSVKAELQFRWIV